MKFRGTTGGVNIVLEMMDTVEYAKGQLESRAELLKKKVDLELSGTVDFKVLELVQEFVHMMGGEFGSLRAIREAVAPVKPADPIIKPSVNTLGRTEIIVKTLRSGIRKEVRGSVIVLGDVNPGVELIADGDVIVVGTLRGLAHAGAGGREDSIIWAHRIISPQVRIADALARAPEGSSFTALRATGTGGAELARLESGKIVIEPQG